MAIGPIGGRKKGNRTLRANSAVLVKAAVKNRKEPNFADPICLQVENAMAKVRAQGDQELRSQSHCETLFLFRATNSCSLIRTCSQRIRNGDAPTHVHLCDVLCKSTSCQNKISVNDFQTGWTT